MTGNKNGIGKGKGQKFAVEKFGVEDEVLKLYKDNIPATKISQLLLQKEIKISPLGINRWLSRQRTSDVENKKIQNYEKFEVMVMDYKREITDILDEVKEMKKLAKDQKQLDSYVKLVGKLFQGLELLAKLMGDIRPSGSVDINVYINELNKKVFNENKTLRNNLYNATPIDVDAEIIEGDKIMEKELTGGKE